MIRARNCASEPRSLAEARFVARNSALESRRFWASLLLHTPEWVKTVNNICGLVCILGLASPYNQVLFTTEKRGA